MTRLVRATELLQLPVVTFEGEDVAEVRDVVYAPSHGELLGFTLNKRGMFAGRLRQVLTLDAVESIGRDAVMVQNADVLVDPEDAPDAVTEVSGEQDVIGASVVTEDGDQLGAVTDVVVSLGEDCEAVGYELGGAAVTSERHGRRVFIPLPVQVAVSGDALVVPARMAAFVHDDLTGFGAAVDEFSRDHDPVAGEPRAPTSSTARTKAELYQEARERDISGRSTMTKGELVDALARREDGGA